MEKEIILKKYIPLDKYWLMRMGFLDILNGKDDIKKILGKEKNLGGDLKALLNVANSWQIKDEIEVGESGTLFRYLQFAIWKQNLHKKLIRKGTLLKREICNNPKIISWPLADLLKLDNRTSQWASAAILLGNEEVLKNPPYFLQVTYEALKHWKKRREKGLVYDIKHDEILLRQGEAFIEILEMGETSFVPSNPDDYCFARAFGLITKKKGVEKFPALKGHESNRLKEMEKCLGQFNREKLIETNDHRVVQAMAMLGILKNKKAEFSNKNCVSKSWPQFWNFLGDNFPNRA